jgi:glycerophosphoryl diester phosphodiesterase
LRKNLSWLTERPIAHRGFHDAAAGRPENTLAAFEAAAAAGYAIECDLHLSSDDVPVVFHDDDLKRLTGETGGVGTRTAEELGRLKVLGTQEKIPTLAEMLTLVAGRVPILIEMKPAPRHEPALAHQTIDSLREYGGPAAVMSFDRKLLAAARAVHKEIPLGLTAQGNWLDGPRHWRAIFVNGLDFISYSINDLPTPMPLLARRIMRLPLICWTVRTKSQWDKAKRLTDQITFEGFAA